MVTIEYIKPGDLTEAEREKLGLSEAQVQVMATAADERGVVPIERASDQGYSHMVFYRAARGDEVIDTGRTRFVGPRQTDWEASRKANAIVAKTDDGGLPMCGPPEDEALERAAANLAAQYEEGSNDE